jgi:hypothetical protein
MSASSESGQDLLITSFSGVTLAVDVQQIETARRTKHRAAISSPHQFTAKQ